MTKRAESVVEPAGQATLTTIDEHFLVVSAATTHRQLRADQTRLASELAEIRKGIIAAESDAPDPR